MSTPLTDSINALTAYANEVTGGSDTTVSDAVHTLASGYGGGSGVWKQKQVTVENAISLGGGFANLITSNVPSGTTFAVIFKDDLDPTTFINNQLVYGAYDSAHSTNNVFSRYRNGTYAHNASTFALWSNTYALTASAGDTYTILYKEQGD